MKLEQPTNNLEGQAVERKEKGASGFRESYNTALQLRNFERGWSKYEDKESLPFGTLVSQIGDRCRNLAESAIKQNGKLNAEFVDEEQEKIKEAREQLVRFEEKEHLDLISPIRFQLDALSEALKKGDAINVFESAIKLKSHYAGFMYANEVLLAKADEASGDYNSATKK